MMVVVLVDLEFTTVDAECQVVVLVDIMEVVEPVVDALVITHIGEYNLKLDKVVAVVVEPLQMVLQIITLLVVAEQVFTGKGLTELLVIILVVQMVKMVFVVKEDHRTSILV